jgi:tetratricopeptide (TPR) repeat protein
MKKDTFRRQLLFIAICLSVGLPGSFGRLPGSWSKAAIAYQEGNYGEAANAYQTLLRQGYRDPALYYNLGQCYLRNGEKGKAVLAFERALRLKPGAKAIKTALVQVRGELTDQLAEKEVFAPLEAVRRIAPARWALIAIIALSTGFILWILAQRLDGKRVFRILAGGCTTLAIFALASAGYTDFMENDPRQAIVIKEATTLFQAPDRKSPEIRQIHEGTKVHVADQLAPWAKIRLGNGDEGWLTTTDIERIVQ